MLRTRFFAVGILLAASAVACSGETRGSGTPSATEPRFDYSAAEQAAGIPPEPDPATWRAYIDALVAIDPAIVDDEEQAVDRGRGQCSSIATSPDDQAKLVDLTRQRFTAPGHPDGFGAETSAQILAVVRQYICPGY